MVGCFVVVAVVIDVCVFCVVVCCVGLVFVVGWYGVVVGSLLVLLGIGSRVC